MIAFPALAAPYQTCSSTHSGPDNNRPPVSSNPRGLQMCWNSLLPWHFASLWCSPSHFPDPAGHPSDLDDIIRTFPLHLSTPASARSSTAPSDDRPSSKTQNVPHSHSTKCGPNATTCYPGKPGRSSTGHTQIGRQPRGSAQVDGARHANGPPAVLTSTASQQTQPCACPPWSKKSPRLCRRLAACNLDPEGKS